MKATPCLYNNLLIARIYNYLKRRAFNLIGVTVSQISVLNPRLKGYINDQTVEYFEFKNCVADSISGAAFVRIGKEYILIAESSGWHPILAQNYFGILPREVKCKDDHENPAIVSNPNNYFHWWLEDFPLIYSLAVEMGIKEMLLHDSAPKYLIQTLEFFDINYALTSERWHIFKSLRFMRKVPYGNVDVVHTIKKIRNAVLSRDVSCSCHSNLNFQKIYLSRIHSKRVLPVEKDVEELLSESGFEIIYLEQLDLKCQITLFATAKFIVASHGAGITNILWTKSNVQLIEIMPKEFHNTCYKVLAEALGLEYHCIDLYLDSNPLNTLTQLCNTFRPEGEGY